MGHGKACGSAGVSDESSHASRLKAQSVCRLSLLGQFFAISEKSMHAGGVLGGSSELNVRSACKFSLPERFFIAPGHGHKDMWLA